MQSHEIGPFSNEMMRNYLIHTPNSPLGNQPDYPFSYISYLVKVRQSFMSD